MPVLLVATALVASLVATLAATLGPGVAPAAAQDEPPGPIHAGNVFKWGPIKVGYNFEDARLDHRDWRVRGRGLVRHQHGMLTLNTAHRGSVSATERTQGHRVGRWEIRLRSRANEHGHRDYRVLTELVPAGGRPGHCGARNVALESYTPHSRAARHYIRGKSRHQYVMSKRLGLRDQQWHTFAVEVTHRRISWFVDARVISSERRRDALTGVPFAVRFTMKAARHHRMNQSRMQMDWLRYWTLKRPNAKSTRAPHPTRTIYRGGC